MKNMKIMITNKLSRKPTVPMMASMTLSARSRAWKILGITWSSVDEDVVTLLKTSFAKDEFSIITAAADAESYLSQHQQPNFYTHQLDSFNSLAQRAGNDLYQTNSNSFVSVLSARCGFIYFYFCMIRMFSLFMLLRAYSINKINKLNKEASDVDSR